MMEYRKFFAYLLTLSHNPTNTMKRIDDFKQLADRLRSSQRRKRVAVVCPHDDRTLYALRRALEEELADLLLVAERHHTGEAALLQRDHPAHVEVVEADGDAEAAAEAVRRIRSGEAEVLMKGLLHTDTLLRAVLDKERGLLPEGNVLTHLAAARTEAYHKFLFFSDAAVIPHPTGGQLRAMTAYAVETCRRFGTEEPKVALIHCTEKVSPKFPCTEEYMRLREAAASGAFGPVRIDGPMDVKTACDRSSAELKGLDTSAVAGDADVLIFPDIEAGNVFHKTLSLFARADMAGILRGASCPVVVTSRSDSGLSKYYSLALACL